MPSYRLSVTLLFAIRSDAAHVDGQSRACGDAQEVEGGLYFGSTPPAGKIFPREACLSSTTPPTNPLVPATSPTFFALSMRAFGIGITIAPTEHWDLHRKEARENGTYSHERSHTDEEDVLGAG
jgi:hypothetical protein